MINQRLQSEDEDAESIAEKLDIFPPSRSGYTQKVGDSGVWQLSRASFQEFCWQWWVCRMQQTELQYSL